MLYPPTLINKISWRPGRPGLNLESPTSPGSKKERGGPGESARGPAHRPGLPTASLLIPSLSPPHIARACPHLWASRLHIRALFTPTTKAVPSPSHSVGVHTPGAWPSHRGMGAEAWTGPGDQQGCAKYWVPYHRSESRVGCGSCGPCPSGPTDSFSHGFLWSASQGRAPLTWTHGSEGMWTDTVQWAGAAGPAVNCPTKPCCIIGEKQNWSQCFR